MRMKHLPTLIAVAALLAAGCASTPRSPALEEAQMRLSQMQGSAGIEQHGADELAAANAAVKAAAEAQERGDQAEVEHYAFLAQKRMDLAKAKLELNVTQETIAETSERRQALLLRAREREAELARAAARTRAQEAELARLQALRSEEALEEKRQELSEAEQQRSELQAQADQLTEDLRQLKEMQMQESERGIVLTLSDIYFDFDSDQLKPGGERAIKQLAGFLREHEDRNVLIEGFTDSVGSADYNRDLAERRARAVSQALESEGVDSSRVDIEGYGERFPIANNDTPAGRQENRRVEIVIGDPAQPVERRRAG